jgi:hypothetical protein
MNHFASCDKTEHAEQCTVSHLAYVIIPGGLSQNCAISSNLFVYPADHSLLVTVLGRGLVISCISIGYGFMLA